ncbi:MAG: hypothetical protein HY824_04495 [Acidobacteria bacterium]|nr:hypothetical protein [Acidobacteriota bacterium]
MVGRPSAHVGSRRVRRWLSGSAVLAGLLLATLSLQGQAQRSADDGPRGLTHQPVPVAAPTVFEDLYTFRTLAGFSGAGTADGTGSAARFFFPQGAAVGAGGVLFVADTYNHTIRQISAAGAVTTYAGVAGARGSEDGVGAAARFNYPQMPAIDRNGVLYLADEDNHTIRRISPGGSVTTVAGLAGFSGSADGPAAEARFNRPTGVAIDTFDNLYVADRSNHTIRRITPAGTVSTIAGTPGMRGSADSTGADARFNFPSAVAVDTTGLLYVADRDNHTIRKINGNAVTTFAGTAGTSGSADATGSAARFYSPSGVTVDGNGNVYVVDLNNHVIRKITRDGVVTTLAGRAGFKGSADGTGNAARFLWPTRGIGLTAAGDLYVGDTNNHTIRRITAAGAVTTVARQAGSGTADGAGAAARFNEPWGIAVDRSGTIYVSDFFNQTIRKISPDGLVLTMAGSPTSQGSTDGSGGTARFRYPRHIAVSATGTVYVTDSSNHTIRRITSAGDVTTLAGLAGASGSADGTGTAARFSFPAGVAVDSAGVVYVSDSGNATIRKITPTGEVTTLAGVPGSNGNVDGTGSAARFDYPNGLAVAGNGTVYVTDTDQSTIRRITPGGDVTTLAGRPGVNGSDDGVGAEARFWAPTGVAVDGAGIVYVADRNNYTIRRITPDGMVTTVAGSPEGDANITNGAGSVARFFNPVGIAVDSRGVLYVADTDNNLIRVGTPTTTGQARRR